MAQIKEIPSNVATQIETLQKQARELLNISNDESPKEIVTKITEFTRACIEDNKMLSQDEMYAIGALLGCQYVDGLGWTWKSVDWNENPEDGAIGVVNVDQSLFNNPIGWVCDILENSKPVTFLLSYNMINENNYPTFDPGSATPLY